MFSANAPPNWQPQQSRRGGPQGDPVVSRSLPGYAFTVSFDCLGLAIAGGVSGERGGCFGISQGAGPQPPVGGGHEVVRHAGGLDRLASARRRRVAKAG